MTKENLIFKENRNVAKIQNVGKINFDEYSSYYGEDELYNITFTCELGKILIDFDHEQRCFEKVYASDEYFENGETPIMKIQNVDELVIESVEDLGIRINTHLIPCYSIQNGNYSNVVNISVNILNHDVKSIQRERNLLKVNAQDN